jgi:hypothetical protein
MVRTDYLISTPHRVFWAGFETTTARMQQAGWKLSAHQDVMQMGVRLAFRHDELDMSAITNMIDYFKLAQLSAARGGWAADQDIGRLKFDIVRMTSGRMMVETYRDPHDSGTMWKAIDGKPQFCSRMYQSLEEFAVFAEVPLTRTQELIVDPNDVQELMSRIIDLQKPEQQRIRDKQRLRESREGLELDAGPKQVFHAQILSIAA